MSEARSRCLIFCAVLFFSFSSPGLARRQDNPSSPAKPAEHFIGTVTAVDGSQHSVTIKEDKTGVEHIILLADTKTLIKVPPGAKDLKTGTRITASDLAVGDRVDIRGSKPPDNPDKIAARSVVLMSARDLQQVHQVQAAEWQHSTAGIAGSIEAATGKIVLNVRTPEGPKQVTLETSASTEFSRYSASNPASPSSSQFSEILPGDQVRVIGERSEDGTGIQAKKVYSGAFRTLNGTVTAISPDGKSLTIKDLATKKPVEITLGDQSTIHRLPPMLAAQLAHRPTSGSPSPAPHTGGGGDNGTQAAAPSGGNAPPAGAPPPQGQGQFGQGGMRARGNADISQMIDRLPKITLADLKLGDALVISGVATGGGGESLIANNIIAGVEPILQSAPARQGGQATGGDWGLGEISAPQ